MKALAWTQPAAFILIATLAVFVFSCGFNAPAMPMDEGVLLVGPELALKGELPYRDFHLTKGPGNLAILSAAYSIFGVNIFVERAVGLTYRLVIALAIFGIARRWGTAVAVGCAAIATWLLAITDLIAHTWIAAAAVTLCSLWLLANIESVWRCFGAGILASFALSCRLDLGTALFLSTMPLLLKMKPASRRVFFVGAATGLVPLLWLMFKIGFPSTLYNLIGFPISQMARGRGVAISLADGPVLRIFLWHLFAAAAGMTAAILVAHKNRDEQSSWLLLSTAILGILVSHYSLERFDWIHVVLAGLIPISLLPISIFVVLSEWVRPVPSRFRGLVAVAVIASALLVTLPSARRSFFINLWLAFRTTRNRNDLQPEQGLEVGPRAVFVRRNDRLFPLGDMQLARDSNAAIAQLEKVSSPGQRLFVGPRDLSQTQYCDTFIYHLLPQLRPATYFIEMHPLFAKHAISRVAGDIACADWLLVDRTWDFMSNNRSKNSSDPATEAALTHFDLWSEHGSFLLFRNKRLRNFVVPH